MHPRIKNGNGILETLCGPSGEVLWDLGCAAFPVQTSALCRVGPAMKRKQRLTERRHVWGATARIDQAWQRMNGKPLFLSCTLGFRRTNQDGPDSDVLRHFD
jgi:hypothetical protein